MLKDVLLYSKVMSPISNAIPRSTDAQVELQVKLVK